MENALLIKVVMFHKESCMTITPVHAESSALHVSGSSPSIKIMIISRCRLRITCATLAVGELSNAVADPGYRGGSRKVGAKRCARG